jgi:hypothetical protein
VSQQPAARESCPVYPSGIYINSHEVGRRGKNKNHTFRRGFDGLEVGQSANFEPFYIG